MLLCITFQLGCADQLPAPYQVIDPDVMMQLQDKVDNFVLVDVRTPEEIKQGYIAGALFIDFRSADFLQKLSSLDKGQVYGIYCGSGVRSNQAMHMMKDMGFDQVYDLKGGYQAYLESSMHE